MAFGTFGQGPHHICTRSFVGGRWGRTRGQFNLTKNSGRSKSILRSAVKYAAGAFPVRLGHWPRRFAAMSDSRVSSEKWGRQKTFYLEATHKMEMRWLCKIETSLANDFRDGCLRQKYARLRIVPKMGVFDRWFDLLGYFFVFDELLSRCNCYSWS